MATGFKETKIGQISEEWSSIRLIETAGKGKHDFTGGPFGSDLKAESYTDTGVRIIQLQNIGDGKFLDDYKIFTSEEKADELKNCNIYPGDIIIAKMANPVARACIIPDIDGRYLMASDGIRLSVNADLYDKRFILHAINSTYFRKNAERHSTGTTRLRIGLTELRNLSIMHPPLPEQNKIAQILSTVDETIEKTDAIIEETHQLKKGLMQKLFTEGIGHTKFKETRIGRIPEEWEVVRFSKCLQKPKQKDPTKKPDEKFTYIDVSAVSNEVFKIVDSKIVLGKDAPSRARKEVRTGDTIYATVRPYLKRVAFVPSELDGEICSTGFCVLRPKPEEISHGFIFQLMLTHRVNEHLRSLEAGTSYPAISDSDVYQMLVPVPPLSEQRKIADILSEVDSTLETEQALKDELEQLKKGLMQVLLTGKVRVKIS